MFSYHDLQVIDVVSRREFSLPEELHKVPSAISYTVRLIKRLAVELFVRLHRKVSAPADITVEQARDKADG